MDLGLTSLMGASGIGGGIGLAVKIGSMIIQSRRADKQDQADREANRDALISGKAAEFQKTLNESPKTIDIDNETSFNFRFWFINCALRWTKKGDDVVKNDARASRSNVIFMLAFTLCAATLLFADNGLYPVWTVPANADPITTEWFWGLYNKTKPATEVQVLSGMGVAFLLCHGILTLISYWTVQAPFNYIRGRK